VTSPFDNKELRDWLFQEKSCAELFPYGVATTGSGPFEEGDFDQLLRSVGIGPCDAGGDDEFLIVGREGWNAEAISRQIDFRRGRRLKVYSQEMLLSLLISGRDPFEDRWILQHFGEGHPALDYLMECGFDWPKTSIVPALIPMEQEESDGSPETGLLGYLGYKTGARGVSRWHRQKILEQAFTCGRPTNIPVENAEEWGEPDSSQRLQKMANSIASFTRNAKRKDHPPEKAIEDWEEDLDWPAEEYYHGFFTFQWPSTEVN